MRRVAIVALVVLACLAGLEPPAHAQGAPRTVVMLVDPGVVPLSKRLRQEIESLGLTVRLVSADSAHAPSLEDEAVAAGAVAAIHIAPMGGGDVDMTILDGATGKTVSWKLVAATTVEPAGAELIATRAVELLRASLMELAARRPARETVAAPEIQPVARPAVYDAGERNGGLSLLAGPALLYGADFRPGAELQASTTWMPLYRLGVTAAVLVPMVPAHLSTREGSVDLFASLFRLGAVVDVGARASPVSVRCMAGAELARLRFEGTANPPYAGVIDSRTTVSPVAGVTARFRVASSLFVVTELMVAVAFPRTVVRLAGREVTDWGRPMGTAAVGLELAWPFIERRPPDMPGSGATGSR